MNNRILTSFLVDKRLRMVIENAEGSLPYEPSVSLLADLEAIISKSDPLVEIAYTLFYMKNKTMLAISRETGTNLHCVKNAINKIRQIFVAINL